MAGALMSLDKCLVQTASDAAVGNEVSSTAHDPHTAPYLLRRAVTLARRCDDGLAAGGGWVSARRGAQGLHRRAADT
ncbi:MAG: hypothetical protein HY270_13985 [Deltaproteobacteria bacterium]|nr:hypothetical protein [Deltaproteobacteria bacterium]